MLSCPNCGSRVREDVNFCPKCGAALKPAQPSVQTAPPTPSPPPTRGEKYEKHEKREKREKREKFEKYEKRELGPLGSIVGGLILIVIGVLFYLATTTVIVPRVGFAFFLILIGIIIVVWAVYAILIAPKRSPQP